MNGKATNEFYDVSRLPAQAGKLVFYISPSSVLGIQSPKNCFEQMKHFTFKGEDKIVEPEVGVNFVYGDTLYLYSEERAADLKNNLLAKVVNHKNRFQNILDDNPHFIKKAFEFLSWNQALLNSQDFFESLAQVENIYQKDKDFQKCLQKDYEEIGQRASLDQYQLKFFLEEITLFYLVAKKEIKLKNEFTQGNEKWVLNCYPRKPLWSHIYLQQLNPLNLQAKENKYENSYYDLKSNTLYDFDRLDLETVTFND